MTLADLSICNYLVPTVVEQTNRGERGYDLVFKSFEREHNFFRYTLLTME